MDGTQTIGATAFRAKCHDILDSGANHELERIDARTRQPLRYCLGLITADAVATSSMLKIAGPKWTLIFDRRKDVGMRPVRST